MRTLSTLVLLLELLERGVFLKSTYRRRAEVLLLPIVWMKGIPVEV